MKDLSQINYLLSFLAILVDRAGGKMVVENLSHYAESNLQLGMNLDFENDRVILTTTKKEEKKRVL